MRGDVDQYSTVNIETLQLIRFLCGQNVPELDFGAIGPKLSVISMIFTFYKQTFNSLIKHFLGTLLPKPLSLIYPELIRNISHINP